MTLTARLLGGAALALSAILGVELLVVVPGFARTYDSIQTPEGAPLRLPGPTEWVIGLSDWLLDTRWFEFRLPGVVVLLVVGLLYVASMRATGRTPGGRRLFRGGAVGDVEALRGSSAARIATVAIVVASVVIPAIMYATFLPLLGIVESIG